MKSLKISYHEAIAKLEGVKAASPMTNGSYVVIYQKIKTGLHLLRG